MGQFVNLSLKPLFAEASGKPQPTPAIPLSGLDELAASIVHEVNQPLSAIKLNGETSLRWLDRDKPDIARARKSIERVLQDVGRALDIVSLIRAMAAGHAQQHSRVALEQVIIDAIELLQHELCSKNVIVDVELTSAASDVIGNRLQLQQLVINLVINAIQALAEHPTSVRRIVIRTDQDRPGHICCTIEDSGPGIDPSHLPHLFGIMFTTKKTGMGIGLIISKSIVEAHGGNIRAENNCSSGGARFSFTLPTVRDVKAASCQ